MLIAKLLEGPRKMKSDEHRDTASELGDSSDFYFITAESVPLRFSAQRTGSASSSTLDPQTKPTNSPVSPSGGHGFWKPFHKSHGKSDKKFV